MRKLNFQILIFAWFVALFLSSVAHAQTNPNDTAAVANPPADVTTTSPVLANTPASPDLNSTTATSPQLPLGDMTAERGDTPTTSAGASLIAAALKGNASKRADRELFLVKDMPQTLSFDYDIGEIAVGNPGTVSVVADRPRRRIVFSPLEVGETSLLIFDNFGKQRDNIQVTVTSTNLDQFVKDLRYLFRDIEGLQFRRVGRKVIIEGEVYLKQDLDRIHDVLKGNEFVVDLVSLSQDTQRILAKRIKDEINISGVEVVTAKDRILLKGEVSSEDESKRAEKIAAVYADAASIVNVLAVNTKKNAARAAKLIQVSAYFVELNKSFLRNFNFRWTPIANTQVQYTNTGGKSAFNFFAIVTEFLPKLNTAKALGVARVVENPTVSVKSGDNANVRSGAQIIIPDNNIQIGNTQVSPNNAKEVGVTMNVTPTADERDFIDMKISVQVSKLGSAPKESAFMINQSEISTSHYVRSGETVAIGGVLRSSFTDVKDAPPDSPFAFQNPVTEAQVNSSFGNIFQIFKSRSISQDRTMFIVFITPEVLNSARDSGRSLRETMNLNGIEASKQSGVEDLE